MKYPAWIKPGVALLVFLVGAIPIAAYLWFLGRVPTMDADTALKVLKNPGQNAILVDVRTRDEYSAMHVIGSQNWPAEKIASLQSLEQMPDELRDKELLLICNTGFQSAQAVEKLHSLGVVDAYSKRRYAKMDWDQQARCFICIYQNHLFTIGAIALSSDDSISANRGGLLGVWD